MAVASQSWIAHFGEDNILPLLGTLIDQSTQQSLQSQVTRNLGGIFH